MEYNLLFMYDIILTIQAGTFTFSNFDDREFVLNKLSSLLSQYSEVIDPNTDIPIIREFIIVED